MYVKINAQNFIWNPMTLLLCSDEVIAITPVIHSITNSFILVYSAYTNSQLQNSFYYTHQDQVAPTHSFRVDTEPFLSEHYGLYCMNVRIISRWIEGLQNFSYESMSNGFFFLVTLELWVTLFITRLTVDFFFHSYFHSWSYIVAKQQFRILLKCFQLRLTCSLDVSKVNNCLRNILWYKIRIKIKFKLCQILNGRPKLHIESMFLQGLIVCIFRENPLFILLIDASKTLELKRHLACSKRGLTLIIY